MQARELMVTWLTVVLALTSFHAAAATVSRTISFDGQIRSYHVTVPGSYAGTAMPLVLDLHGFSSNASQQMAISGFKNLAEQEGFIAVHPEGHANSWNAYRCCGLAQANNLDDVGLMRAIVAEVADQWNVDLAQVYATGLSNGASMANRLGCEAADLFAGIATVSYPLASSPLSSCQPEYPITVLAYHGTADVVIPYWGSLINPAVPVAMSSWRQKNSCSAILYTSLLWGNTSCRTYAYCDDNVNTTRCTVTGGMHVLYFPSANISISSHAWNILQNHSR